MIDNNSQFKSEKSQYSAGKKVSVISLGCDKNRVDTETMLFNLNSGGFVLTDDYSEAQIIIVNTCAFIQSARKEAIDTILGAIDYKVKSCEKLLVTGCLPQKYAGDIANDLPEVDAFLGTADYENICGVIKNLYKEDSNESTERVQIHNSDKIDNEKRILTTHAHLAYLKIADGCDNHCTFCTIPSIRGKYRSRSIESLVLEAKGLAEIGVKEIILVAQDVTRYGFDLYNKYMLVPLIKELSKLDIVWIRLMYCYPELVSDELIAEIIDNPKVCKYIDIPIQHADDKILKLMGRRSNAENLAKLFEKLQASDLQVGKPQIAIRTTVMVGFPSETEEEFNKLYDFICRFKPRHVGVFAYSKEEDTPSAKIKGHLSLKVKKERVKKIGELHLKNCREQNSLLIGQTVKVLYEDIDYERNLFKGRMETSAPDIDTFVYFTAPFADVGNIYDVVITKTEEYDLIGEVK